MSQGLLARIVDIRLLILTTENPRPGAAKILVGSYSYQSSKELGERYLSFN